MNYIYDILLNLQDLPYMFYDWNEEDSIDHIRKIPLYKIGSKELKELEEYEFVLDCLEMERIKDKTEVFDANGVDTIAYAFLVSDGMQVLGFECNHQGKVIGKSRLLIDEENEVLEVVNRIRSYTLHYQKLNKCTMDMMKTRKEIEIETYIQRELKCLKSGNIEKLKYLYYECFDKKLEERIQMLKEIETSLREQWSETYPKIYSFLKLTGTRGK